MQSLEDPRQAVERHKRMVDEYIQRAIQGARISTLVGGALFALAGVGFGVMLLPPIQAMVMPRSPASATAIFALLCAVFVAVSGLFFYVSTVFAPPPAHLATEGRPGRAILREVRAARFSIQSQGNSIARSALVLDVTLDGQPPYTVVHSTFVPLRAYPRLRPGTALAVRVDPAKPSLLLVEWDRA